jgi:hypothetical protein
MEGGPYLTNLGRGARSLFGTNIVFICIFLYLGCIYLSCFGKRFVCWRWFLVLNFTPNLTLPLTKEHPNADHNTEGGAGWLHQPFIGDQGGDFKCDVGIILCVEMSTGA